MKLPAPAPGPAGDSVGRGRAARPLHAPESPSPPAPALDAELAGEDHVRRQTLLAVGAIGLSLVAVIWLAGRRGRG